MEGGKEGGRVGGRKQKKERTIKERREGGRGEGRITLTSLLKGSPLTLTTHTTQQK